MDLLALANNNNNNKLYLHTSDPGQGQWLHVYFVWQSKAPSQRVVQIN